MHAMQKSREITIAHPDTQHMDAFFTTSTEPPTLATARVSLDAFVRRHAAPPSAGRVVLVTSGGTTVPLEKNTVRFIDNFSTGNRGAASVEQFLELGYAVVFVHRRHSAYPFARRFMPPALSAAELLQRLGTEEHATAFAVAAAEAERHATRLLALPFDSVHEYLHLLRASCLALAAAGPRAMLYLAAAVSDFFVPEEEMAEHKIQSGGSGGGGGGSGGASDGGLTLQLRPVPKLLGAIKRGVGGAPPWAPQALLVTFKLETNAHILRAKAAAAIAKYGVDVVCANQLQSYKREVTLVQQSGAAPPVVVGGSVAGDETADVAVEGIRCSTVLCAPAPEGGGGSQPPEIEAALLAELTLLHAASIEVAKAQVLIASAAGGVE